MAEAERVGKRLQGAQAAGPTGAVGGARGRVAGLNAEGEALRRLAKDAELAAQAEARLNQVRSRGLALPPGQTRYALPPGRQQLALPPAGGTGGGAGGGGGPPLLPPGPPVPPSGGDDSARSRRTSEVNRQATAMRQLNAVEAQSRAELQRQVSVLGASSQAYRKHGALTTEFIADAARGAVSYREWGYQIGATAGKFAGWTAVSIPVFAALDGVRRLGQGAIASASGVDSLKRVINNVDSSRLQGQFRDLSREFNLPIDQVSEAVYRMGQVFHTQDEAVTAARASLLSFRTGEVDVATSTRYLNAIVRGFGLTGTDLVGVYDQINQAQNRFGITIADTEAGTARAAGAFKNAGGSISFLLGLIGTMQQVTGRTGENVGTAVQRSVGFIQRPKNQEALRGFGIDPTQGIEQVYTQAFEKAQTLQGEQLQQLASALSSPQYASYFVPLLQNYDRFRKFLKDTSPAASQGSAQKELQRVLSQTSEELKRFGTELQILGSNLASSGLLAPLAGALHVTLALVGAGNQLFSAFNGLKSPSFLFGLNLKQATVAAFGLLGIMRALQRFGIGHGVSQRLEGISGIAGGAGGRGLQRQVGKGIRDEVKFFEDERAQRARRAAIASSEADIASQEARRVIQSGAADEDITKAQERHIAAREHFLQLSREEVAVTRQLSESQARANAYQRQVVKGRKDARTFVEERGLYYLPTLDRPTTVEPTRGTSLREIALQRRAESDAATSRLRRPSGASAASSSAANRARALSVLRYMDEVERSAAETVTVGERMRAVPARTGIALNRTGQALRGMGRNLQSVARQFGGLFGPFEIILAGAILIPAIYEARKRSIERAQEQLNDLSRSPRDAEDIGKLRQQAAAAARDNGSLRERAGRALRETYPGGGGRDDAEKRRDVANATLDALILRQQQQNAQLVAGSKTGAQRGPRLDLFRSQIDESIKADGDRIRRGVIGVREARRRMEIRVREIFAAEDIRKGVPQEVAARQVRSDYFQAIAERTKKKADFIFALDHMTTEALKATTEALEAEVGAGFGGQGTQRRYSLAQFENTLRQRPLKTDTPEQAADKRTKFAQFNQQLEQTLEAAAKTEFDRAILFSRSTADRNRAWAKYENSFHEDAVKPAQDSIRSLRGQRRDIAGDLRKAEADAKRLRGEKRAYVSSRDPDQTFRGEHIEDYSKRIAAAEGRVKRLRGRLKEHDDRMQAAERELKILRREEREFKKEIQRQRFQEQQELFSATTDVRAFHYGAGTPRLIYVMRRAHDSLVAAIREYGRGSIEALRALQTYRQSEDAVAEEVEQTAQARAQYLESLQPNTGTARARTHLSNLYAQLSRFRGDRQHHSEADIYGVMAEINDTRQQIAEQAREEAKAMSDAQWSNRLASVEDPVNAARIEVQKARDLAKYASTPAEKIEAQAEIARSVVSYRNAQVQGRVDRIEFLREMDKIDADTAISMYRQILKTGHLSREWRRRIQLAVHALQKEQDQGALELQVGNIRLPSIYEVRRGLGVGRGGGFFNNTTNNNEIHLHVHDHADRDRVGKILEEATGSSLRSRGRARGLMR